MTGEHAPPRKIVVMGVSASGKSSLGRALAAQLDAEFVDADDLHPPANIAKMTAGIPLDDDDRWPWLDVTAQRLTSTDGSVVIACSALRRAYRDRIRALAPDAVFVHLTGVPALLEERSRARADHFMPASLLASQWAVLEDLHASETGFVLDFARPVAELVEEATRRFR
jgi:gluconokinase